MIVLQPSIYNSPLFSSVFPFLLIFAVVYGLLERINLFPDRHDVNAIIALALGALFAASSAMLHLAVIILPVAALIAFFAFFAIVLSSFIGGENNKLGRTISAIIVGVISIVLIILYIIIPLFPKVSIPASSFNINTIISYIVLLVFIVIVIWIMSKG
ncbi:MAG: hypothetical protein OH318_02785 [Candidatus Parvarchaeota archaeon]|nr:hypothetical protein [Candidatus Rehaiarchaeum fermentans]